jgi:beta-glucosidase-like glycosyl hydrolase
VRSSLQAQSTVLLKNDNHFLPLSQSKVKNILVVGSQAQDPIVHGGGSGR